MITHPPLITPLSYQLSSLRLSASTRRERAGYNGQRGTANYTREARSTADLLTAELATLMTREEGHAEKDFLTICR